jgi:D-glycero-alpha-D-manno-heptose-7-phosphate kinase
MIITRAPLRISFFGGGTDFPEFFTKESGAVLATAINQYSFVTASHFHSQLFDYSVRVSYSKGELVGSIDDLLHPVFRECLRYCNLLRDIELHTVADLPSFSGLGSSSSFTVALLTALHAYKGEYRKPLELAYEAIHIERNVLGDIVGVQDQTTAAVGGFNVLEFKATDDIRVIPVALSPQRIREMESHMLLVYTGIKRRAAEVEQKKLKNYVSQHATLLEMRRMVDVGYEILVGNRGMEQFGRLLDKAWNAKRELSPAVSNDEIESLYTRAKDAGAWGGKLLGAGAGGFLLFFAAPDRHDYIKKSLLGKHIVPVTISASGAGVIFAQ